MVEVDGDVHDLQKEEDERREKVLSAMGLRTCAEPVEALSALGMMRWRRTCPLLPELSTEGEDVQDALKNANDALAAIVDGFKQLKRPLPSALQPEQDNTPLWVETVLAV